MESEWTMDEAKLAQDAPFNAAMNALLLGGDELEALKPMKALKAMKAMKKISVRLAKRHVFAGKANKTKSSKRHVSAGKATETKSGLSKGDLVKNKKSGKIVSARLAKGHVFAGKATKTKSGLSKGDGDLVKNKSGKTVSKKASATGKKCP